MSEVPVLAWGRLVSADFADKTLEFRIEGDMPTVAMGRYAIVDAERLRIVGMQARLWRDSQPKVFTKDAVKL
jgi:hypothetical protein